MPPVAKGQASYETNTTAFTAPLPLSGSNNVQPGDVVLFTVTTTSSTATTLTPAASSGSLFPSGVGTSDACQSQGWYWVLPDPVPANLTVTAGAARQGSLVWDAYRGIDATSPMDAPPIPGNQQAASTSTPVMPSITTATPGAIVVGGICHGSGSTTITTPLPSPWTVVEDGTRRNGLLLNKGPQAVPGPSGTATFTLSSGQQSRMWTAALRPAASEPADPPIDATLTSQPYPGFTGDIADGAAIVRNAADPASSVVITTNKDVGGGLYVLGLDGQIRSSRLDGAANSVDWREWDGRILVATTDREDSLIRFYWLNQSTGVLTPAGQSAALGWEPYGSCLYMHSTGVPYVFVTQRGPDDTSPRNLYQYPLTRNGDTVTMGAAVRTVGTSSVVEGLAADDVTGYLFASEEDVGLYRYSAAPNGGTARVAVDTVGAGNLFADVEDVAVSRTSEGAWLLVSSQGDSSYHVYDLATFEHVQRFTVARPGGADQVTSTDGLDFLLADLGPSFPNGLIVVHDGDRTPVSDFAFVDAGLVFGELPAEAITGTLTGALPRLTGSTSGQVRVTAALAGTLPKVTGSAAGVVRVGGTLSGTLPALVGQASGTVHVAGTATATLPRIEGASAGVVGITGTLFGALPALRSNIGGSDSATAALAATLPALVGSTTGQVRITGTLAGTLPRATGSLAGTVDAVVIVGALVGLLPALTGRIRAVDVSDDVELVIVRGPYGHPLRAGSPRGNPLTVSSPRR